MAHLLGSSVTLARDLGADVEQVYRTAAWSLITPMFSDDIDQMVEVADRLDATQRTEILEDTLAVFTALMPVPEQ